MSDGARAASPPASRSRSQLRHNGPLALLVSLLLLALPVLPVLAGPLLPVGGPLYQGQASSPPHEALPPSSLTHLPPADTARKPGTENVRSTLSVSISASTNVTDEAREVTFHAVVLGGVAPYNLSWRSDQGSGASFGPWVNWSFPSAGNGTVTVWANDSAAASVNASYKVLVNLPFTAGLFFRSDPTDAGIPELATAVPYEGTPPYTFRWALGDGTNATGISALHTYTTVGTYYVSLNATDAVGASVLHTEVLTVLGPPTLPTLTIRPSVIDLGENTTLNASVSGGSPPFHQWFSGLPPGCGQGTGSPLVCDPNASGNYTVTVYLQDQAGANVSATALLAVEPLPRILAFSVSPSPVTQGNAVLFSLVATGGAGGLTVLYSGLPGGCAPANVTSLTCVPAVVGNFTVAAQITDGRGAATFATVPLEVRSPPPPPVGGGNPPGGNTTTGTNATKGPTSPPSHGLSTALLVDLGLGVVLAALVVAYLWSRRSRNRGGRVLGGKEPREPGRSGSRDRRSRPDASRAADGEEELDAPVDRGWFGARAPGRRGQE